MITKKNLITKLRRESFVYLPSRYLDRLGLIRDAYDYLVKDASHRISLSKNKDDVMSATEDFVFFSRCQSNFVNFIHYFSANMGLVHDTMTKNPDMCIREFCDKGIFDFDCIG